MADLLDVLAGIGKEDFTDQWVAPEALARDPIGQYTGRTEIKKFQFAWANIMHSLHFNSIKKHYGPTQIVVNIDMTFR